MVIIYMKLKIYQSMLYIEYNSIELNYIVILFIYFSIVTNKIKSTKHHTSSIASKVELKLEADFGFKRKQSLVDCISSKLVNKTI